MKTHIPPSQLWIGPTDTLQQEVIIYLQKQFCANKGCRNCATCMAIRHHQYHALMVFNPEKLYTIADLDPLFATLAFALAEHEHYFFIINNADGLNAACSNKLLKSIEEPPPGYHFIFLTQRADQILPTIRSRCTERNFFEKSQTLANHELFDFFTHEHTDPNAFLLTLEKSKITEQESSELLDALIEYWTQQYNDDQSSKTAKKIDLLIAYLEKTPMPGSSKIFWKDLYLAFTQH
jgi:DNA polymerase III gamma/tau subunit